MALSITTYYYYAECHYAEYRGAKIVILSFFQETFAPYLPGTTQWSVVSLSLLSNERDI
jgi:hypothetical protein